MEFNPKSVAHEDVKLSYGYLMLFSTIIVLQLLNWIITRTGTPKSVTADPWRWRNLFISWIHAFICGTWDVLCFVFYPELLEDPIVFRNYFVYLMIALSTGYFIYDSLDLLINNKLFQQWEVFLHHIAVTTMFWYNMHFQICIGFNAVALMAEVNSFFLHSRKLLQMSNWGFDHWLYKTVSIINLLTFASFRGYSNTKILIGMAVEKERVPHLYYIGLLLSMSTMTIINLILFWRLLKSDLLNVPAKKKMSSASIVKINGNNNLHHEKDQ